MTSRDGIAPIFSDWWQYNAAIVDGVRDLTTEQLALRAGADHGPIWALAAHLAGARPYWLCHVLGEPGSERSPLPDPASGLGWEDDESQPRTAEELVLALETTWSIVADCLDRWSVPMLSARFERTYGGVTRTHTRQSILLRLLSHDGFHAGEISQLLGVHGLPPIDLWRPPSRSS